MINFKNFLLMMEELNQSQKETVSKWPRDPAALAHTDHYFGKDNDDITTPLDGTQDKSEVHKKVEQHIGRQIPIEDYKANKTTDKYNRSVGVSKLIKDPELLQNFNNDSTRQGKKYTGLSVHVTRSAHGVAGQTSGEQSWADESCKNFNDGMNRQYLKPEVKHGTVVTYLKDHTGKEIARATLHPHYNNEGHVAYAVNSYYGIDHADFKEHVERVAQELSGPHKGGNYTYTIHPDVYNDMGHDKILHPQITSTQLEGLQKKFPNNTSIHRAIYNHPNTTDGIIHNGIKSDNEDISLLALDSSKLKPEHIDTALEHESMAVRGAAFNNNKITRTQLHKGLKDESHEVRIEAILNENIKPEHIDVAMKDENKFVRDYAVSKKTATPDHIHLGLDDPDYSVRLSAIRNRNASVDNITKALNMKSDGKDENDSFVNTIQKEALYHKNAGPDHYRMGLSSNFPEVKETAQRQLVLHKKVEQLANKTR